LRAHSNSEKAGRSIHVHAACCQDAPRDAPERFHQRLSLRSGAENQVDNHVGFRTKRCQIPAVAKDVLGRQVGMRIAAVKDRDGVAHPLKLMYEMRPNEAGAADDENLHLNRLLQPGFAKLRGYNRSG
jgi:hypothetical protein